MHVMAIDCHWTHHSFALLDEDGTIIREGKFQNRPRDIKALRGTLPEDMIIGFEGPQECQRLLWKELAGFVCYEICPAWTHAARQRDPRRDKDDRKDAQRAAAALYEWAHILVPTCNSDENLRALKAALSACRRARKKIKSTKNVITRYIKLLWGADVREVFTRFFSATAIEFFKAYPHPSKARRSRALAERLRKWSRGRMKDLTAAELKALAADAVAPTLEESIFMGELLEAIEDLARLQKRDDSLSETMLELLEALGAEWLMAVDGIGFFYAAELVAGGFLSSPGANSFARHSGIAPVTEQTGNRSREVNAWQRNEHLFQTVMGIAAVQLSPSVANEKAREYRDRKLAEGKSRPTALRCLAKRQLERLFRLRREHRPELDWVRPVRPLKLAA